MNKLGGMPMVRDAYLHGRQEDCVNRAAEQLKECFQHDSAIDACLVLALYCLEMSLVGGDVIKTDTRRRIDFIIQELKEIGGLE